MGIDKSSELQILFEYVNNCTRCILHKERKLVVFGEGNVDADIMVIGEAPGKTEDETGHPFIGSAGDVLMNSIIKFGYARNDIFIANIVKCRPPENRQPNTEEITACIGNLYDQIALVNPKFLLLLGATASNSILQNTLRMKDLVGQFFDVKIKNNTYRAFVNYHPASLLYSKYTKEAYYNYMDDFFSYIQQKKT